MKFSNGDVVQTIYFTDEEKISADPENGISIIVSMENGQYAEVPWFEVWKDNKCLSKWNSAMICGVELMRETE